MKKFWKLMFMVFLFTMTKCFAECTSFCLTSNDTILFGNNLDWYIGDGLIVINKRNVSKTGCWFSPKPSWTSKYGSITINQFGREFPSRGMNEAGLVIGEMTLSETQFPDPDFRTPISLLQWIQYQLDNCATIEEVIATETRIRIEQNEYHSHFLVADSSGNCLSMEWLNGSLVFHAHDTLPIKVLTNNTYASCLEYYNSHTLSSSSDFSSKARFYRAAEMIKDYDPQTKGSMVGYALFPNQCQQ
ncbi:MAG: linear amide C-N hydrolase [bacterium]